MTGSTVASDIRAPFLILVLHYVRYVLSFVIKFICVLYYGKEGEKIPLITDEILKLPAIEVARKIRNKEVTSVEVLETCIRRIKDVNPALNCLVEDRFELALQEAKAADELIKGGEKSAEQLDKEVPFLGVPFTTKDCINVKGLHNTSGVVLRKDLIMEEDADVIKLLRASGAIIIGLTNVPELCMWWESHNHIYGRTKNPYNTTRIVGGSSGGEACIQAAAGSIFGIGSDIGGSIRMPAYFNGVYGHKPSRFIVSNAGEYPETETDLHNSFLGTGPITRHAVDLKPIMKVIAGENIKKLELDKPVDVGKLKIFYQYSNKAALVDPVDPEIIAAMDKVLEYFNVKYKTKGEEKDFELLRKSIPIWMSGMKGKRSFGNLIMGKDSTAAICLEIFKNFIGFSGNTLIGLFTALTDKTGPEIGSEKYKKNLKLRDQLEQQFKEMLGDDGIFLYPTHPTTAPYHNEPLIRFFNFSYTSIINCLGLPSTTVPLGLSREGMPIGIQVIANHDNDRICLAVAEELDKAFGGWIEPQKS